LGPRFRRDERKVQHGIGPVHPVKTAATVSDPVLTGSARWFRFANHTLCSSPRKRGPRGQAFRSFKGLVPRLRGIRSVLHVTFSHSYQILRWIKLIFIYGEIHNQARY